MRRKQRINRHRQIILGTLAVVLGSFVFLGVSAANFLPSPRAERPASYVAKPRVSSLPPRPGTEGIPPLPPTSMMLPPGMMLPPIMPAVEPGAPDMARPWLARALRLITPMPMRFAAGEPAPL